VYFTILQASYIKLLTNKLLNGLLPYLFLIYYWGRRKPSLRIETQRTGFWRAYTVQVKALLSGWCQTEKLWILV